MRSRILIDGSLTVHREVADSEIHLDGDLEVMQSATFGQDALRCRNALFHDALTTTGSVECETLDVRGDIRGAGEFKVTNLVRVNALSCERLFATGDISASGKVQCAVLDAEGTIDLAGAATAVRSMVWKPKHSHNRLILQKPHMVVPSVTVSGPELTGSPPTLVVKNGIEVIELRVETPRLAISVEQEPQSGRNEARAVIGARLANADSTIRLTQGTLNCRLEGGVPPFALHADADSEIYIEAIPHDLASVRLCGDGKVTFDDPNGTSRLKHVEIVGPINFASTADIEHISMSAQPQPSAEAAGRNEPPSVNLGPGVVVQHASGVCRLNNLAAKIDGHPRRGLAVTSISSPANATTDGHLTNVDLSGLPDEQIRC